MMNVYQKGQKASVPRRLLGGSDTSAVIEKINKNFMNGEVWGPIGAWKDQMVRVGYREGQMAGIQAAGGSRGQSVQLVNLGSLAPTRYGGSAEGCGDSPWE